jgi:large conductance mechanosensitive channel
MLVNMEAENAENTGFNDSFKAFVIGNNILTVMAAVTIAFSTGTMIRSLVGDIILPAVYAIFASRVSALSGAFAPINKMNLDNFIKEFITWCFVIVTTFLIIEYVIRRWYLKHPSTIAPEKKSAESNDVSAMVDVVDGFRQDGGQATVQNRGYGIDVGWSVLH